MLHQDSCADQEDDAVAVAVADARRRLGFRRGDDSDTATMAEPKLKGWRGKGDFPTAIGTRLASEAFGLAFCLCVAAGSRAGPLVSQLY
jgi:hypothetical protein